MSDVPVFGAGIWRFATYKDRYATDGYGPPVGLTQQIDHWAGVWQLDQFPFREDSVAAAQQAIRFLKAVHGALDSLDEEALAAAQASHDALAAQRLIQKALLTSMAGWDD